MHYYYLLIIVTHSIESYKKLELRKTPFHIETNSSPYFNIFGWINVIQNEQIFEIFTPRNS